MSRNLRTFIIYILTISTVLIFTSFSSQTVTTLAEIAAGNQRHCIVIDPGHGGEDGGAVSHSGYPESKYNLEIALKLNDMLNFLGYNTRLTRDSDVSIYTQGQTLAQKKISDLKERVKKANEPENGVLLSIHQNFYADSKYSGPQVFYAKTNGSDQLAQEIQSTFLSVLNPENKRQIKACTGIYLMEHIQCPGVLIECGFLSNQREESMLKNPVYQQKICSAIAVSVSQYLSNT